MMRLNNGAGVFAIVGSSSDMENFERPSIRPFGPVR